MPNEPQSSNTAQCDLVMKGGITSGVVYPKLISELSSKYRFKNIGGTSAGAIAAAGCAAAEHRRRTLGDDGGFAELSRLPDELGSKLGTPERSRLFHLFQPAPAVAKHFAVLVSMLNAPPLTAVGRALLSMVRQFWGMVLLGVALALLLFAPVVLMATPTADHLLAAVAALALLGLWWLWAAFGLRHLDRLKSSPWLAPALWWLAGLLGSALLLRFAVQAQGGAHLWVATLAAGVAAPLTIGLVLALSGLRFAVTLANGMHRNGYGMCSGRTMHGDPAGPAGLTDWLSRYFNQLAGLKGERPLLFGDLWGAEVDGEFFSAKDRVDRQINLQVMTTAVSQQMCFSVPFHSGPDFYYDRDEWDRLFPDWVMQWIDKASAARAAQAEAAGTRAGRVVFEPEGQPQRVLTPLPHGANLPVVVAVRMSLSFPALLSAVPLYAVDFTRKHNQRPAGEGAAAQQTFTLRATRVWFSDGGIASNMPLHFFDAPLPGHPTFAIDLKAEHPDYPIKPELPASQQDGRVFLPQDNGGGVLRHWPAPNDDKSVSGLVGFLVGIVHTMQNWRDELQFPYPGYRDRIVQVSQRDHEGGLNLDMEKPTIDKLSEAGQYAAQRLIARFHPPQEPVSAGWKNHRDVRLRTFLGVLEEMALGLHPKLTEGGWNDVLDGVAPNLYSQPQRRMAKECLQRLADLGALLKEHEPSLREHAPKPRASMRIAPRI
jgi:hypothetical protein